MRHSPVAAAIALGVGLAGSDAYGQDGGPPAEQLFQEAAQLAQSGDLLQAEAAARHAVLLQPGEPDSLAVLATILALRGAHGDASDMFAEALQADPSNLALRRNLAVSQWRAGRVAAARASIESVLARTSEDSHSVLLAGMIAEHQGRHPAAARLLEQAGPAAWERAEAVVAMARSYYRLGRPEDACRALERLEPTRPGPLDYAAAGTVAFEAGDFGHARNFFDSAERSGHPERASMLFNAALSSYRRNDFAAARTALDGLLEIDSVSDEAWSLLGWTFEKGGETERARQSLEKAIEIAPDKEKHHLDLGTVLASKRETWHLAMETVERALARHPSSHRLHQLLGLVQVRQQHFLDAIVSYGRALDLAPESADLHLGLLVAVRASGQVERAIQLALESIVKFPRDGALRHQLGRIYLDRAEWGDPRAAELGAARLREAIALDPGMADAHFELGSLALRQGDPKTALPSLRRAVELAPRSGKAHYALARCLRRLGRERDMARAMQAFHDLSGPEGAARRSSAAP